VLTVIEVFCWELIVRADELVAILLPELSAITAYVNETIVVTGLTT
jgi:hypothetical protein